MLAAGRRSLGSPVFKRKLSILETSQRACGPGLLDIVLIHAPNILQINLIAKKVLGLIFGRCKTSTVLKGYMELAFCRKEINSLVDFV